MATIRKHNPLKVAKAAGESKANRLRAIKEISPTGVSPASQENKYKQ
ncbi:hypothetical protein [Aneurinibacillus terranovensis]|nr:hypothetical protein [Aneurinibacillus terranovensis]